MGALLYMPQSCSQTGFPYRFDHGFPIAESQMSIKKIIHGTVKEETAQAGASEENTKEGTPSPTSCGQVSLFSSLQLLLGLSPPWTVVIAPFVIQRICNSQPLVSLGFHSELNLHLELQLTNQTACSTCITQQKVGFGMLKVQVDAMNSSLSDLSPNNHPFPLLPCQRLESLHCDNICMFMFKTTF